MDEKWDALKKEFKKVLPFIPVSISYVFVSTFIGYFLVVYIGLPKLFFASPIGLPFLIGIIDYFGSSSLLLKIKEFWLSVPMTMHFWIIIDCIAYYFLFKAYLNEETLWKNLLNKLQKN